MRKTEKEKVRKNVKNYTMQKLSLLMGQSLQKLYSDDDCKNAIPERIFLQKSFTARELYLTRRLLQKLLLRENYFISLDLYSRNIT